MVRNRWFDEPKYHDAAFYADREPADYLNQKQSALRLYLCAAHAAYMLRFSNAVSVADFGCGSGGLLWCLARLVPHTTPLWGYDLCPANVLMAEKRLAAFPFIRAAGPVPIRCLDFVHADDVGWPHILVMTEVLEHLPDPDAFLRRIPSGTQTLFTVPAEDYDGRRHDWTHLWSWTEDSFTDMVRECNIEITLAEQPRLSSFKHYLVVGRKR